MILLIMRQTICFKHASRAKPVLLLAAFIQCNCSTGSAGPPLLSIQQAAAVPQEYGSVLRPQELQDPLRHLLTAALDAAVAAVSPPCGCSSGPRAQALRHLLTAALGAAVAAAAAAAGSPSCAAAPRPANRCSAPDTEGTTHMNQALITPHHRLGKAIRNTTC
jgi:hypothetical protein